MTALADWIVPQPRNRPPILGAALADDNGGARMGDDPRDSVVSADCRSWDIPNLWVCDGAVVAQAEL